jgi:hypothetical protein
MAVPDIGWIGHRAPSKEGTLTPEAGNDSWGELQTQTSIMIRISLAQAQISSSNSCKSGCVWKRFYFRHSHSRPSLCAASICFKRAAPESGKLTHSSADMPDVQQNDDSR